MSEGVQPGARYQGRKPAASHLAAVALSARPPPPLLLWWALPLAAGWRPPPACLSLYLFLPASSFPRSEEQVD